MNPRLVPIVLAVVALAGLAFVVGGIVDREDEPAPGRSVAMAVSRDGGGQRIGLVEVTIGGRSLTFAVDTGASNSEIDRRIARELKLRTTGRPTRVTSGRGVVRFTPVQVRDWRVGDVPLKPSRIASALVPNAQSGAGVVGRLGADVLGGFGSVKLDYEGGRLILGG